MIYIPLVYFSFLSFVLYKRHKKINIATIISLMFAISGLFSVLVDINDYRGYETANYQISFVPTFLYCFLLTLCILPISSCDIMDKVRIIPVRKVQLIKLISIISVIWFVLKLYLGRNNLVYVLTNDMSEIRADVYAGFGVGESWMNSLPTPIRLIFSLLNLTFGCPWTLLFLGFYTMIGNRVPLKYSYLLLIASVSGPLDGIMGADRSATAYWIIAAITVYILFQEQLPKKVKKQLLILGLVFFIALVAYLIAMTVSRFGESEGAWESVIRYLGIPYINFCYFFDNYKLPFHHFGIIFPFTSEYLLNIPSGGTVIQAEMTRLSHFETGTFYTFIGQIIVGVGQFWAIIFTLIYSFSSFRTLGQINKKARVDIVSLYIYFAFVSVILLGIFVHYYASAAKTFSLIAMYFIVKIIRK